MEVDPPVAEPDPARAAAEDLGDITELAAPLFPQGTLDGAAKGVAWYRFTLSEAREVALGLRRQDADADLVVEDAAGNVLHSGANDGTANEWVRTATRGRGALRRICCRVSASLSPVCQPCL